MVDVGRAVVEPSRSPGTEAAPGIPRSRSWAAGSADSPLRFASRRPASASCSSRRATSRAGVLYVYEEAGHIFDAGPTVITAPHTLDELFEVAGRRREDYVEFIPVRPFYRHLRGGGRRIEILPRRWVTRELDVARRPGPELVEE